MLTYSGHKGSYSHETCFISLPNDKILDWFKMKELADDKINVYKKLKFDLEREENIVEKEALTPFPTMFSYSFIHRVVKSWDCVVKS